MERKENFIYLAVNGNSLINPNIFISDELEYAEVDKVRGMYIISGTMAQLASQIMGNLNYVHGQLSGLIKWDKDPHPKIRNLVLDLIINYMVVQAILMDIPRDMNKPNEFNIGDIPSTQFIDLLALLEGAWEFLQFVNLNWGGVDISDETAMFIHVHDPKNRDNFIKVIDLPFVEVADI